MVSLFSYRNFSLPHLVLTGSKDVFSSFSLGCFLLLLFPAVPSSTFFQKSLFISSHLHPGPFDSSSRYLHTPYPDPLCSSGAVPYLPVEFNTHNFIHSLYLYPSKPFENPISKLATPSYRSYFLFHLSAFHLGTLSRYPCRDRNFRGVWDSGALLFKCL